MLEAIAAQTGIEVPPGRGLEGLLRAVNFLSARARLPVRVDESVLTERAALMGIAPKDQTSANGMCRIIRTRDGWIAVNLPRPDDTALLPAWIGREAGNDAWEQIAAAAREQSADALVTQGRLLGLAVARVREPLEPSWRIQKPLPLAGRFDALRRRGGGVGQPADRPRRHPLVLDMSSLWAGPLCGALLADAGADVIKLESTSRPDGARLGNAAFFARLNSRKRTMTLDLPRERERLRELIAAVDVVIESARPRVWAQWGFPLPEVFAANPHLTWISITAYGRDEPYANWVGFGDEVAAAAGLVTEGANGPAFVGDAIADPLAGLGAAASAFACLAAGGGFLVEANLFAAAKFVASC